MTVSDGLLWKEPGERWKLSSISQSSEYTLISDVCGIWELFMASRGGEVGGMEFVGGEDQEYDPERDLRGAGYDGSSQSESTGVIVGGGGAVA